MSATQASCFQSIQVCAIRVTRLSSTGLPMTGAGVTNGYIGKAPIMAKLTPDNQTGVELSVMNGCGTLAGYYNQADQLKKYMISLELTDLDNELIEILTDEPIVTVGGLTIGHTSKRVGACTAVDQNGVALEIWTKKWEGCGPPTGDAYWHWFAPRAYLRTGEVTMQNDFMRIPVEGFLQENPVFNVGGWTASPWPGTALLASWGVVSEDTLPTAACGYQAVV